MIPKPFEREVPPLTHTSSPRLEPTPVEFPERVSYPVVFLDERWVETDLAGCNVDQILEVRLIVQKH